MGSGEGEGDSAGLPGWSLSKEWRDESGEDVRRSPRGLSAGRRSGGGLEGLPDVTGICRVRHC